MSFRLKTILGLALISATLMAVMVGHSLGVLQRSSEVALIERARTAARLFATSSKDALLATDLATLESVLTEVMHNPGVVYARVLTADGVVLSEAGIVPKEFRADMGLESVADDVFDSFAPIVTAGQEFGRVELGLRTDALEHIINDARRSALTIAFLGIALVALFSALLGHFLTRQLRDLEEGARQIGAGNWGHQMRLRSRDELGRTAKAFNRMSARLASLYGEMEEKEARKSAMLNSALDSIVTINGDGRIIEFNPAAERTFGHRREAVLGKSMADLIIPQRLRAAHVQGMKNYQRTGEGVVLGRRTQVPALHADGTELPVELAVNSIRVGNETLFTAYLRDLRSQKHLEAERERLQRAVEASADMIFVTDPQGHILNVNSAFCRNTGWSREDALGQTPRILKSHRNKAAIYEAMWKRLKSGQVWTGRLLNRRRGDGNGSLFWVQATIAPIRGERGDTTGYVAVERDITEQVEKETHERYERELAEIRAQVARALWATRPIEQRLAGVLGHLSRLKGIAPRYKTCIVLDSRRAEVKQRLITADTSLWPQKEVTPAHLAHMYSLAEEGIQDLRVRSAFVSGFLPDRRDGLAFGHYAVPLRNADIFFGALYVFTEEEPSQSDARVGLLRLAGELVSLALSQHVTGLEMARARAAAENASQSKSLFLANMSHEIRTPLYGVMGMLDLLAEAQLPTQHREHLDTAQRSAKLLLSVIDDVLDFSRIEAGELRLEKLPFDPAEVVEDVTGMLAERAEGKGLELSSFISTDVPHSVMGDAHRFSQVLVNLTNNALKFTSEGEVRVRLQASSRSDGAIVLECSVRDTGIGIPAETQARLFQPFSQADASTNRRYGGSGLGLAICKQLVTMMGGEIGLESKPGEGSEFRFTLPCELAPGDAGAAPDLTGVRILAVDDNATNLEILRHYLEGLNAWMHGVSGGSAALQELAHALDSAQPYQLCILDLQMPMMDGLELAARIRANPHLSEMPLLLLSSVGQLLPSGQRAHIDLELSKPVRRAQLEDALRRLLRPGAQSEAPAAETSQTETQFSGRVLLVEDNDINQTIGLAMLRKLGLEAELARDGQEAIDAARGDRFDIILMDCQMPVVDGFEATRGIRELERENSASRTPIIALTANAMAGDREACLNAGMDDYLAKPLRAEDLRTLLCRHLQTNRPTEEQEPMVAEPDAPMLNTGRLNELKDLVGPAFADLCGAFGQQAAETAEQLRDTSLDTGDLARLLHRLKGSAANLGADRLAELSAGAEERLKAAGLLSDVERQALLDSLQASCRALENLAGSEG